jgi:hypothetical protein
MIDEFQRLLDQYLAWLKDKTSLCQVKDWVEITTPYLDRHNDYLQIYAKRENGAYLLTDGGETIEDLRLSGCSLDSPRRQELLRTTLNGFGVKLNNNALEVRASTDHFALRKHNLVQAMLAVNDLFFVASPIAKSLFYEDVVAWLEAQQIRYIPNVTFTGKSGYDHLFDFAIPKSQRQPERILHALSRPRRDTAIALAFAWHDTRDVRPAASRAYALLNDSEHPITSEALEALRNYEVNAVPWSHRDDVCEELAA